MAIDNCINDFQTKPNLGTSTTAGIAQRLLAFSRKKWANYMKHLRQRRTQKVNRQAFQTMLGLDEALLKDIGVTRCDVKWASTLPMELNAAHELQACRRRRIRKQ